LIIFAINHLVLDIVYNF